MTFTIEKNIDLYPMYDNRFAILHEMEAGDSILVDYHSDTVTARTFAKRNNIKIATRRQRTGGYRIWRVS